MKSPQAKILRAVAAAITANLEDPTHEMRVAFQRLTDAHKAVLFALIDADDEALTRQRKALNLLFTKLSSNSDRDIGKLLLELSEGFIRVEKTRAYDGHTYPFVTWIHPSCRDLAIEELCNSNRLRSQFLANCSISGLQLAISVGGGAIGNRTLPLLRTDTDWRLLRKRYVALASDNGYLLATLASTIEVIAEAPDREVGDEKLLRDVAFATLESYAKGVEAWTIYELKPYLRLRKALDVNDPIPGIASVFHDKCSAFEQRLLDESQHITALALSLRMFGEICRTLASEGGRQAKLLFAKPDFRRLRTALISRGEEETNISYMRETWGGAELKDEADSYLELGQAYGIFANLPSGTPARRLQLSEIGWQFESEAENLTEQAAQKGVDTDDPGSDEVTDSDTPDDDEKEIKRIFADL